MEIQYIITHEQAMHVADVLLQARASLVSHAVESLTPKLDEARTMVRYLPQPVKPSITCPTLTQASEELELQQDTIADFAAQLKEIRDVLEAGRLAEEARVRDEQEAMNQAEDRDYIDDRIRDTIDDFDFSNAIRDTLMDFNLHSEIESDVQDQIDDALEAVTIPPDPVLVRTIIREALRE